MRRGPFLYGCDPLVLGVTGIYSLAVHEQTIDMLGNGHSIYRRAALPLILGVRCWYARLE